MTMLLVKKKFVDLSGRTDLVVNTTDYVDTGNIGTKFFIQAATRFLDQLQDTPHSTAELAKTLTIGDSTWEVSNLRSIESFWINDTADTGWNPVTKKSLEWIRNKFSEPAADITNAVPQYWAPDVIRVPITEGKEIVRGIIFMPPTDSAYSARLVGKYWSKVLSADSDINYWSENHEDILVAAAMYKLEEFYRNTEGMNDWLLALKRDLEGIDFDLAFEDSVTATQMRG